MSTESLSRLKPRMAAGLGLYAMLNVVWPLTDITARLLAWVGLSALDLTSIRFAAMALTFAACALCGLTRWHLLVPRCWGIAVLVLLRWVIFCVSLVCYYLAANLIGAGAIALFLSNSLIKGLWCRVVRKQPLPQGEVLRTLLGTAGVACRSLQWSTFASWQGLAGIVFGLLSAVAFTVFSLINENLAKYGGETPVVATGRTGILGLVGMAVIWHFSPATSYLLEPSFWADDRTIVTLCLMVAAAGVTQVLMTRVASVDPRLGFLGYGRVVPSVIAEHLLFGAAFTLQNVLGAGLLASAFAVAGIAQLRDSLRRIIRWALYLIGLGCLSGSLTYGFLALKQAHRQGVRLRVELVGPGISESRPRRHVP